MELLRPADRERLLSLRTSTSTPPADSRGSASLGLQQQQEALTAWRGVQTSSQTFRPFEKDPSKQERYELYLGRLRQGHTGGTSNQITSARTQVIQANTSS